MRTEVFSPGIYDGVPLGVYRQARGVSYADISLFSRSPAHYAASQEENREDESKAPRDGFLLHLAILDPDLFGDGISHHVRPEGIHFGSKEGRAWRDARLELPILTKTEHANIEGARDAVMSNSTVRALFSARGANHVTAFGCHPRTGLALRMRADRLTEDAQGTPWIVDIKSCPDARKFAYSAREFHYDAQSAFSRDVLALAGLPFAAFVFVAVEIEPTHGIHAVRLVMLDEETHGNARAAYERELERFAECERAGVWPGHPEEIEYIRVKRRMV